ncbi:MAG: hypothetical protein WA666_05585 [Nitrospirota bacterium]
MNSSVMKSREDYILRVTAQVRQIDQAIDELREKSENENTAGRLRDRQSIIELTERRDQATTLLGRLHESCEDCWDEVKRDADGLLRPGRQGRKTLRKAA